MNIELKALFSDGVAAGSDGVNLYRIILKNENSEVEKFVRVGPRKVSESGWDEPRITSDLGDFSSETILQMVENFDKSVRMMMHEFGPIEAEPPCFVPEKMRPLSIVPDGIDSDGNHKFRVSFGMKSGPRDYRFNVEPSLGGLDYEDHFYDDMGKSTQLALPLFSAIVDFYRFNHPKAPAR